MCTVDGVCVFPDCLPILDCRDMSSELVLAAVTRAFLHTAGNDVDQLKHLLLASTDPNEAITANAAGGGTPMRAAIANGSLACLQVLLEAGADPNGGTRLQHHSALLHAVCLASNEPAHSLPTRLSVMQMLLCAGACPNEDNRVELFPPERRSSVRNPLKMAMVFHANASVIRLLHMFGACLCGDASAWLDDLTPAFRTKAFMHAKAVFVACLECTPCMMACAFGCACAGAQDGFVCKMVLECAFQCAHGVQLGGLFERFAYCAGGARKKGRRDLCWCSIHECAADGGIPEVEWEQDVGGGASVDDVGGVGVDALFGIECPEPRPHSSNFERGGVLAEEHRCFAEPEGGFFVCVVECVSSFVWLLGVARALALVRVWVCAVDADQDIARALRGLVGAALGCQVAGCEELECGFGCVPNAPQCVHQVLHVDADGRDATGRLQGDHAEPDELVVSDGGVCLVALEGVAFEHERHACSAAGQHGMPLLVVLEGQEAIHQPARVLGPHRQHFAWQEEMGVGDGEHIREELLRGRRGHNAPPHINSKRSMIFALP